MHQHAFLIMAHNNWYNLEKLIQIIDAPWNDIYLHIDCKAKDFNKHKFINLPKHSKIRLTKRHNVSWGNESQITAEMALFEKAYKHGPYYYYHFLSGSDLPLLNAQELYDFFERKGCNYLHTVTNSAPFEWRLKIYSDVFRAKWIPEIIRNKLNVYSEIFQYKFHINRLTWLKSKYPTLGKGHNWCDLTQNAVEILLQSKKNIRKFTRFTHCTDEMYKQIILLNQPVDKIGDISETEIRYIDWSDGGSHPRTLTIADYDKLYSCKHQYVFARKFDEKVDCEIIDTIYNNLCGR